METLKQQRGVIKSKITRFRTYLNNFEKAPDLVELKARVEKFKTYDQEFESVQIEIEALDSKGGQQTEEWENFETDYYSLIAQADKLLMSAGPRQVRSSSTVEHGTHIKLPDINLPVFNGAYDQWLLFYDTFKSLIDTNQTLNSIQKFQYLRSSLKADALQVINNLEMSSDNYSIAWQLLKDRFENKKLINHNHVKALFEYQSIQRDSYMALRQFLDNTQKHLRALQSLGEPTESWDTLIIYLSCTKLDQNSRKEWEIKSVENEDKSTLKQFFKFLQDRCNVLESLDMNKSRASTSAPSSQPSHSNKIQSHSNVSRFSSVSTQNYACPMCKQHHNIYACQKFLNLNVADRIQEIKRMQLCFNCFRNDHQVYDCRSGPCKRCSRRHNTLLHQHISNQNNQEIVNHRQHTSNEALREVANDITQSNMVVANYATQTAHTQVLLSTALVEVFTPSGQNIICRVLLDSGSQSNFITTNACKLLALKPKGFNVTVNGINSGHTTTSEAVHLTIKSRFTAYHTKLNFLVIPTITENLPLVHVNLADLKIPTTINLADPDFNKPNRIDMLIGAEIFYELLCIGQIKSSKYAPTLQKTQLGWVISGNVTTNLPNRARNTICHFVTNETLNKQLQSFWEVEEIENKVVRSEEERNCEMHFQENFNRDDTGRFMVKLPFKQNLSQLGNNSREIALRRFYALERRLDKVPDMKQQYIEFMREYQSLGHMSLNKTATNVGYYLPHHSVLKEDSITTKLRVVFDGSTKTASGLSLNDTLMKGPTIQDELLSIIFRFRFHNYVLTADIEKMYRQINVSPEDSEYQKILWRENKLSPVHTYTLNTVTYGTTCAPFLAIRSLNQLAIDEQINHPIAAKLVLRDFYVDDLITGTQTLEEAVTNHKELTTLLRKGGFVLRKWRSNNSNILKDSIEEARKMFAMPTESGETTKTLGLYWNSSSDSLQYHVQTPEQERISKRTILSNIARLFDPLGLLGPVIIIAKMIMQKLWQLKIDWDESVPVSIYTEWSTFKMQLAAISKIKIPRKVVIPNTYVDLQLHGFCDASEKAFGACIYIKATDGEGKHSAQLLCSKSKVAPLKSTSLPRLELCAALLLTRLVEKVTTALHIKIESCYCWTDSTIVLAWIAGPANKWKTFVANRVAEIQTSGDKITWRHVSTHENPADVVSRGIMPEHLENQNLWWSGPVWLSLPSSEWPGQDQSTQALFHFDELEQKRITLVNTVRATVFERYSSFDKLIGVVAYCLRFKDIGLRQEKHTSYTLNAAELERSLIALVKLVQQESFSSELQDLQKTGTVNSRSSLLTLNPFLDEKQLIRVGGRIRKSPLPFDSKHQLVLPSYHKFTRLLVQREHLNLLHAGPQAVLASLRKRFWPLKGREVVRHVTRACVICFKCKPSNQQPAMGDLPKLRLQPARPFLNCGVDFCGPMQIVENRRRGRVHSQNCYVAVFICFVTKAVHLELVGNLTTESFLSALRRFTSRRGNCAHIHSDNATNFVKANKELLSVLTQDHHWNQVANDLTRRGITWHFIPARSPHFGGLWEAGVKSVKHHLHRITKNLKFTYEEYYTQLTQIEAVLNSRPLLPISTDPNDFEPITPAHFLIGDSLTAVPEANLSELPTNRLSRWEHVQQLRQHFWKRWSKEYLNELQQRRKWLKQQGPGIQVGALVILKEENLHPMNWRMGRILQLHPGSDKIVRVVSIKTNGGVLKRAVNKVCVLPITDD